MTDDNYPFAPAPDRKQAGSPLLDAALAYAARRLPVFPLIPCGKTPAIKRSFHDATLNPQTIRRHWRIAARNIGIATGASSRAWVLDIDGEDGEATLRRLEARYGSLPPTREVITGGGGRHLWFEYTVPIPSTAGRIGLGVDTRGDGGYVVVPPSVHPNGRAYEWAEGCDELAVAPSRRPSQLRGSLLCRCHRPWRGIAASSRTTTCLKASGPAYIFAQPPGRQPRPLARRSRRRTMAARTGGSCWRLRDRGERLRPCDCNHLLTFNVIRHVEWAI
jgi:hypothetical protein